ncbi:restriction endonuclease subunit S [Aerosakkonema sp. BLCC-F183]|uniref:restriction endonuclease subunit S n=1 Tax=Aerosakkonema sp. BLCC-F183 TaxID=3342834 RepID=UPI0035BB385F
MGEDLYELPKGWVWVKLEDISIKITDGAHKTPTYLPSGIPFLSVKDIYDKKIHFAKCKYISQEEHLKLIDRCNPEPFDILITKSGTIGRTAVVKTDKKFSLFVSVALIKPFHQYLSSDFLSFALDNYIDNIDIQKTIKAGVIKNFHIEDIKEVLVPLPPLLEQYRIVAKIEELFTELDAGVELLKKLKAKLKRYRQAVLKAAVEGNLTKEWREANQGKLEPASILCDRILKQRREKWEAEQLAKMKAQGKTPKDDSWKLKYKEPIAPDTSDLPELPDGWCWASLDTVLFDIKAGKSFKCENENPPSPEAVGVIKVSAVTWGEFNELESKTCTEQSRINPELFVREGDFLFSRANTIELVGACVIAKKVNLRVMLSDKILRFYFVELSSKWILFTLRSRQGRNDIERLSTGNQESMRNIGQDRIRCIRIPIAPLQEMEQIINEVERHLSVIDQLEKTINSNLKRAEKLRQSILKQAFEGKLVPQDPNDEPAEKLLERIKAEKAKQTTTKTKRKTQSKTQSSIQLELPLE